MACRCVRQPRLRYAARTHAPSGGVPRRYPQGRRGVGERRRRSRSYAARRAAALNLAAAAPAGSPGAAALLLGASGTATPCCPCCRTVASCLPGSRVDPPRCRASRRLLWTWIKASAKKTNREERECIAELCREIDRYGLLGLGGCRLEGGGSGRRS